jgi:hypothetical protein
MSDPNLTENSKSSLMEQSVGLIGSIIGLIVVGTVCYISAFVDIDKGMPVLTNVVGAILGFYFGTQTKR